MINGSVEFSKKTLNLGPFVIQCGPFIWNDDSSSPAVFSGLIKFRSDLVRRRCEKKRGATEMEDLRRWVIEFDLSKNRRRLAIVSLFGVAVLIYKYIVREFVLH